MANTGYIEFGSISQTAADIIWTNLTNALTNDATYASASTDTDEYTYIMKAVDASAALAAAIPSGADIDGLKIRIKAYTSSGGSAEGQDYLVQLIVGGTLNGANKATLTEWNPVASREFGGAADGWSVTAGSGTGGALTRADVIATDFGVGIQFYGNGGSSNSNQVYLIEVDVYYTAATPPTEYADGDATTEPAEASGSVSREIPVTGAASTEPAEASGAAARIFEAVGDAFIKRIRSTTFVNTPTKIATGNNAKIKKQTADGIVRRVVVAIGAASAPGAIANTMTIAYGDATIPAVTVSTVVERTVNVSSAAVLPSTEASGTAIREVPSADGAAVIPAATAKGYAHFAYSDGLAIVLPQIIPSISMSVGRSSDGDASAPAAIAEGVVLVSSLGSEDSASAVSLGVVVASGAGSVSRSATGDAQCPGVVVDSVIEVESNTHAATSSVSLPGFFVETTVDSSSPQSIDSDGDASCPAAEASGVATNVAITVVTVTGATTLGVSVAEAAGSRSTDITGDATVPGVITGSEVASDSAQDSEATGAATVPSVQAKGYTGARTIKATGAVDIPVITSSIGGWKVTVIGDVQIPAATAYATDYVTRTAVGAATVPSVVGEALGDTRGPTYASTPQRVSTAAATASGSASRIVNATGAPQISMIVMGYDGKVERQFSLSMELPAIETFGLTNITVGTGTQLYTVLKIERIPGTSHKRVYLQALEAPILR